MSSNKKNYILEFEKPLEELNSKIIELQGSEVKGCEDIIERLKMELESLKDRVYSNLEPVQKLQIARHPERPYPLDYVQLLGKDWIELH
jgi:acetyl-CoA carboxylase carboxyl transferase subunit alpha